MLNMYACIYGFVDHIELNLIYDFERTYGKPLIMEMKNMNRC